MNKPRYGNWVSNTLLNRLLLIASAFALMVILNAFTWHNDKVGQIGSDVALLIVLYWAYLSMCRKLLTYDGGGVMEKFHNKLIEKLPWDGEGTMLDVGCGSGALAVKCAKTFDNATITAVDGWTAEKDFTQEQCEMNAYAEEVATNISFAKQDIASLDFPDESFDAVVSAFAYRTYRNEINKRKLLMESLRVLKKGGSFAIVDMFGNLKSYGSIQSMMDELEEMGITDVHYEGALEKNMEIPRYACMPGMIYGTGVLYGRK